MSKLSLEEIQNIRKRYLSGSLDITNVNHNPLMQFEHWFNEAVKAECEEPNAFVLSTANNNKPHSRIVLFKGFHDGGLAFFTNYQSSKGEELKNNPSVAMNFFWHSLERQVRIEGVCEFSSLSLSDEYFKNRPRGSQIGAVASPQSQVIDHRKELEDKFKKIDEKFQNSPIPRPEHWGGYIVRPQYFEFWQGRDNRLHDRISYKLTNNSWTIHRLAP